VQWIKDMYQISTERACRLGNFSSSTWYRKSTARDQSALRMRIREIAMSRPRFGYERIHVLLVSEGWQVTSSACTGLLAWKDYRFACVCDFKSV
jgi:hypothetical protein